MEKIVLSLAKSKVDETSACRIGPEPIYLTVDLVITKLIYINDVNSKSVTCGKINQNFQSYYSQPQCKKSNDFQNIDMKGSMFDF